MVAILMLAILIRTGTSINPQGHNDCGSMSRVRASGVLKCQWNALSIFARLDMAA